MKQRFGDRYNAKKKASALGCLEIVVDSVVAVFFRCWRARFSLFSELILSGIEF